MCSLVSSRSCGHGPVGFRGTMPQSGSWLVSRVRWKTSLGKGIRHRRCRRSRRLGPSRVWPRYFWVGAEPPLASRLRADSKPCCSAGCRFRRRRSGRRAARQGSSSRSVLKWHISSARGGASSFAGSSIEAGFTQVRHYVAQFLGQFLVVTLGHCCCDTGSLEQFRHRRRRIAPPLRLITCVLGCIDLMARIQLGIEPRLEPI